MIYVILGQPRTGTHLVMSIFESHFKYTTAHYALDDEFNYLDNTIVHTHDVNFTVDSRIPLSNISLIVVKRRDIFAQLMSCKIAERSGQWTSYATNHIEPFNYHMSDFLKSLYESLKWYDDLDLGKMYNDISVVYYEDILEFKDSYIQQKLGISNSNIQSQPSPFKYKDIILNWESLKNQYNNIMRVYNVYGYHGCIRF